MKSYRQIILMTVLFCSLSVSTLLSQDRKREFDIYKLMNAGKYEAAIIKLDSVLTNDKNNYNAKFLLGISYQNLSRHQEAVKYFKNIINHGNEDNRVLLAISKSYEALGMLSMAEQALNKLLKKEPANRTALIILGRIYEKQNKYAKSLLVYKKLIAEDKNNPVLYKRIGICSLKNNDINQSIKYFKTAISLNNKDETLYIYLNNAYQKKKEYSKGKALCSTGLKIFPDSRLLRRALAENLFSLEKYADAYKLYSELINMGDSTKIIFKKFGISAYFENNYPAALYALKNAIDKNNPEALPNYYLGLTFKELKNYDKAIFYINRAAKLYTKDHLKNLYIQLGDSYTQNNDYKTALVIYKKLTILYPEWAQPLFYIATVYDKYYADRRPALEYYQLFIDKKKDEDNRYTQYAAERIDKIMEELHFQKR